MVQLGVHLQHLASICLRVRCGGRICSKAHAVWLEGLQKDVVAQPHADCDGDEADRGEVDGIVPDAAIVQRSKQTYKSTAIV